MRKYGMAVTALLAIGCGTARAEISPFLPKVGDRGRIMQAQHGPFMFTVTHIFGRDVMMLRARYESGSGWREADVEIICKGTSTEGLADGSVIELRDTYEITGTEQYFGQTRFVMELYPSAERREEAAREIARAKEQQDADKMDALRRCAVRIEPTKGLDQKSAWFKVTVKNASAIALAEIPVDVMVGVKIAKTVKIRNVPAGKERSLTIKIDGQAKASPICRIASPASQPATEKEAPRTPAAPKNQDGGSRLRKQAP